MVISQKNLPENFPGLQKILKYLDLFCKIYFYFCSDFNPKTIMSKTSLQYQAENAKLKAKVKVLEKENAFYKDLISNFPGMIFVTENWFEHGKYCVKLDYSNDFAHTVTGHSREDCRNMDVDFAKTLLHPDDYTVSQQSFNFLSQEKNTGKPFAGPYRFKLANGEYAWGLGCEKSMKPDDDSGHRKFANCVIPFTEEMHNDKQIQALIARSRKKANEAKDKKMNEKDLEILKYAAKGYGIKGIAAIMKEKIKTTASRISRLEAKLGLRSMVDLASYAHTHGFADNPENCDKDTTTRNYNI